MYRKSAPTDLPLLEPIKERWSTRAFSERPIDQATIDTLFEAARWTPSSYNEQPWRYLYATKDPADAEPRAKLESLLVEGNAYAKNAYLLIINFAKKTFTRNDKENRHAMHDLGAANFALVLQATSMGLATHQMAGFDWQHVNAILNVPDEFIPGSMMAIGYPGDASLLSPELQEREKATRVRRERSEFVFKKGWPTA